MGDIQRGDEVALAGHLVLANRVAAGRITVDAGRIISVEPDAAVAAAGPIIVPGFVDLHVHGGAGYDAMGPVESLSGIARHLACHGGTSFLPTAETAPMSSLRAFADRVRAWAREAPGDAAEPLGFHIEGPFLAPDMRGAHDPAYLRRPSDATREELEPLLHGLRMMTLAPELPGARPLISWLREHGVVVSLGHSMANLDEARAGYAAGATSTTHLFNAMSGVNHHAPGLAVAALADDSVFVELIADGHHVHASLWKLISRVKPRDRLVLVSDGIASAGAGDETMNIRGLQIEVTGGRAVLAGTKTLVGSVIALDSAVRNAVRSGIPLPDAVAAASRNPLALLGIHDRGTIAVGQRADLVELGEDLRVLRVMRNGRWIADREVTALPDARQ